MTRSLDIIGFLKHLWVLALPLSTPRFSGCNISASMWAHIYMLAWDVNVAKETLVSTSAIELFISQLKPENYIVCPVAFRQKSLKVYCTFCVCECFSVFQSCCYKKMLSKVWLLRSVAFYCACVLVKKGTGTYRFNFVSHIFISVKTSKGWTETYKYSRINISAQQWGLNRFCLLDINLFFFFFQLKLQERFLITVQITLCVFCSI